MIKYCWLDLRYTAVCHDLMTRQVFLRIVKNEISTERIKFFTHSNLTQCCQWMGVKKQTLLPWWYFFTKITKYAWILLSYLLSHLQYRPLILIAHKIFYLFDFCTFALLNFLNVKSRCPWKPSTYHQWFFFSCWAKNYFFFSFVIIFDEIKHF